MYPIFFDRNLLYSQPLNGANPYPRRLHPGEQAGLRPPGGKGEKTSIGEEAGVPMAPRAG